MTGIFKALEGAARESAENFGGRYDLASPPELTAEMAATRWKDVNRLLHSLVVLRTDLTQRRTLAHVLRSARALVGADRGVMRVRDLPSGGCRVISDLGFPAETRQALCGARRLATAAMVSRKPQLVSEPLESELAAELKLLGGGACLTVPVLPEGIPWGTLQLLRKSPFGEHDGVLIWIYVMALEEALAGVPPPIRVPASREAENGMRGLQGLPGFLKSLDEQLDRSAWSGRPLSVLRIHWSPSKDGDRQQEERLGRAAAVACRSLRPGVILSRGGQGDLLIALPGEDAGEAKSACRSLRRNLVQSRVLGEGSNVLPGLQLSSVTFPGDGRSREELLSKLREPFRETADRTRP